MHTPHPTLPGFAPGHKLPKPSKSMAHFSDLAPLILLFFYRKTESKGEDGRGVVQRPPPKDASDNAPSISCYDYL